MYLGRPFIFTSSRPNNQDVVIEGVIESLYTSTCIQAYYKAIHGFSIVGGMRARVRIRHTKAKHTNGMLLWEILDSFTNWLIFGTVHKVNDIISQTFYTFFSF